MSGVVIQAIIAFLTFVFLTTGINLIANKKNNPKRGKLFVGLAIFFFALTLISIAYFICDIFIMHLVSTGAAWTKLFLYILAFIMYFVFVFSLRESYSTGYYGGYTLIVFTFVILVCAICCGMDEASLIQKQEQQKYNEKVIVQEPQTTTIKYELIALQDTIDVNASYEDSLNGNVYGNIFALRGSVVSNGSGKLEVNDVYKLYYLADSKTGKILPKTLDVNTTPLYYVEEGETPYLARITTRRYSLDYNVDPPRECNAVVTSTVYELHIPKGSILETIELDMK